MRYLNITKAELDPDKIGNYMSLELPIDTNNTTIELNGSEVVSVNVGDTYQELGATFIIDGVDYKDDVIVEGSVKTDKAGTYVITYKLENELYNIVLKRIVTVGGVSNGN